MQLTTVMMHDTCIQMIADHCLDLGNRTAWVATDAAAVVFENGYPKILAQNKYGPEYTIRRRGFPYSLGWGRLYFPVTKARHVWDFIYDFIRPATYYVDG